MKRLLVIALLSLLVPCLVHAKEKKDKGNAAAGNSEQELSALTDQLVQALLKGDTRFFEKYYADDVTIIRRGTLVTKAEDIENFKSGAFKFETYDVHDKKIHTYGDTEVIAVRASAKVVSKGKAFGGDFRVAWVWVKQNGNWKLVLYGATPIPTND